jgi:hypothetical protein
VLLLLLPKSETEIQNGRRRSLERELKEERQGAGEGMLIPRAILNSI